MSDFELLVIGSGPGGQRAAIAAAKLGRTVAVIERRDMISGVCINTGTIPSKTLREAVIYLRAARSLATRTACSSCWYRRRITRCSECMSSAARRPNWCTSDKR